MSGGHPTIARRQSGCRVRRATRSARWQGSVRPRHRPNACYASDRVARGRRANRWPMYGSPFGGLWACGQHGGWAAAWSRRQARNQQRENAMSQQTTPEQTRHIVPAASDPIRIVPLYLPNGEAEPREELAAASNAAPPHLVYNQGPLISAVQVYTIFWGPAWQQQQQLMQSINGFFDFILTSPLIDQLAEYSVPNYSIGHGR